MSVHVPHLGDGDVDVVFLTQNSVEWLENIGGPLLLSQQSHVISGAVFGVFAFMMDSLALMDFNRDGRMDVCAVSSADRIGKISVFPNQGGTGAFVFGGPEIVVSDASFGINGTAICDMDLVR